MVCSRSEGTARRSLSAGSAQAVSALGNVVMTVCVASQVSASQFGRYALAYSLYVVLAGVARSALSEPFSVLYSGDSLFRQKTAFEAAAAVLGLAGVAVAVPIAILAFLNHSPVFIAVLAAGLPFLLVQEALRVFLVVSGRARRALALELGWTVSQVVLLVPLVFLSVSDVWPYVGVWVLTCACVCLVGLHMTGTRPTRSSHIRLWWSEVRALSVRYACEFIAGAGGLQFLYFMIVGLMGVAALAGLRGAQTLLGPFNVLLAGLTLAVTPEAVRAARRGDVRLPKALGLLSATLATTALASTLALMTFPERLGHGLLGDSWSLSRTVLLPAGVTIAGNLAALGATIGLRSLALGTTSLRTRIATTGLVVLIPGLFGFAYRDLVLTAWSIAGSVWLGAVCWWWAYLNACSGLRGRTPGLLLTAKVL